MVHVFKTSVSAKKEIKIIRPLLNSLGPKAIWNFDLKDCDHILRVDCPEASTEKVIQALKSLGFDCEELQ